MTTIRRFPIHVPQLVGRLNHPPKTDDAGELSASVLRVVADFDLVMSELQRFLRYMVDASAAAQVGAGIDGVDAGSIIPAIEGALAAVVLEPRQAKPHLHGEQDIPGLTDIKDRQRLQPRVHIHRQDEVSGLVELESLEHLRPKVHVHGQDEVLGLVEAIGSLLLRLPPHTHRAHDVADLQNSTQTVLASQVFGP